MSEVAGVTGVSKVAGVAEASKTSEDSGVPEAAAAPAVSEVSETAEVSEVPAPSEADAPGATATPDATDAAEQPKKPWEPTVRRWWLPISVVTVALEAVVLLRLGVHWSTLPVALFASTAVVLSVIDFAVLRLPNILTEPTALAVCGALVAQALAEHRPHHLLNVLYGALATGLFYLLMRVLSRGGLGVGDVKVGAVAGALLAARGLQPVFDGLLVAWLVTVLVAVAMMLRRRKQFPYGPGILLGAVFVLLV